MNDDGTIGGANGVALAGLNHKMGSRGTANCVMSYGDVDGPSCIGELLGEEGQGLPAMFIMMNEARISVGTSAVAQGYAGYIHSLNYALERTQGRLASTKDPSTPQVKVEGFNVI